MSVIQIGVADDHPVVLAGVRAQLAACDRINIVFTCSNLTTLYQELADRPIHLLLCDLQFAGDPLPDGLPMIERITRLYPSTRLIMLSAYVAPDLVAEALRLGVRGFIGKARSDFANLSRVILDVADGLRALPPDIASAQIELVASRNLDAGFKALSSRELTVARMTSEGLSISEIASRLNRSRKTISNQKVAAMRKLGARNDIELASSMKASILQPKD